MIKNLKLWGVLTAIISTYSTLLALFYQYGFWLHFRVNPLAYASLSEVTTNIILVTIPIALIVFISLIPGHMLTIFSMTGEKNKKLANWILLTVFLLMAIVASYLTYKFKEELGLDLRAYLFCMLPIILIAPIVNMLPAVKSAIPNKAYRFSIVAFLSFLPFLCPYSGWQIAHFIVQNKRYSYIPEEYIPKSVKKLSDNQEGIKYIGRIGSHIFLAPFNNSALIITSEEAMLPLVLVEHYYKGKTECENDSQQK